MDESNDKTGQNPDGSENPDGQNPDGVDEEVWNPIDDQIALAEKAIGHFEGLISKNTPTLEDLQRKMQTWRGEILRQQNILTDLRKQKLPTKLRTDPTIEPVAAPVPVLNGRGGKR